VSTLDVFCADDLWTGAAPPLPYWAALAEWVAEATVELLPESRRN
jgi:hypothetical protein